MPHARSLDGADSARRGIPPWKKLIPSSPSWADAILDGDPIDWSHIGSSVSNRQRRLLDELRILDAIAAMHRQLPAVRDRHETDLIDVAPAATMKWGRLQLFEQLGAGTFGTLFRAWDPRLQRDVAIKMLPVPAPGSEDCAAAVIHEGRLIARLRHPNIVTIYDAEQIGDVVGLCMELVQGRTLDARIEQDGPLTSTETVKVGLALCGALSAVHDAGLLHRDVKASNVMLSDHGRIVLMDFGAAHEMENAGPLERAGTPLYVAPEVLDGGAASVSSDLYSLGVLLHRALTGSYPAEARCLSGLRAIHDRRRAAGSCTVRNVRPDIPARVVRVIDRAIDPRPDRRFASAAAMMRALSPLRRRSRYASRCCLSQWTTPSAGATH